MPATPLDPILARIRAMPLDVYNEQYESLRDEILALGPDVLPHVLKAAKHPDPPYSLDLLMMVLADAHYRPALPAFVRWLDHPNEEVRFIAAWVLDDESGERFKTRDMIVRGHVQHDQVRAAIPKIKAWWWAYEKQREQAGPDVKQLPFWLQAAHFGYNIKLRTVWLVIGLFLVFFGGLTLIGLIELARPDGDASAPAMVVVFGLLTALAGYLAVANVILMRRRAYIPVPGASPGPSAFERAFKYNVSDLAMCRLGYMTDNLKLRLRAHIREKWFMMVLLTGLLMLPFTAIMGVGLGRQILFLIDPARIPYGEAFELWQVLAFGVGTAMGGGLLFWVIRYTMRSNRHLRQDIAAGRVESVRGVIRCWRVRSSRSSTYYVQIGDFKSVVTYPQYRCFVNGQTYTLYYAPASGLILAAGP
jgi:hypothetical protein